MKMAATIMRRISNAVRKTAAQASTNPFSATHPDVANRKATSPHEEQSVEIPSRSDRTVRERAYARHGAELVAKRRRGR